MRYPEVYVGRCAPFIGGKSSAIVKHQMTDALTLLHLGLAGDEQAESRIHGGADRALCHYPREHYDYWRQAYPQQAERFEAAVFGENLSTLGMDEASVFIGDIYRWGEALIQVTQPRSPCYKLNQMMEIGDLSLHMQQSGRRGWLYRVVAEGRVGDRCPLELVSRNGDISVAQCIAIVFHMPFDEAEYRRLLACAGLSASWCKTLQNRLLHGRIEEMNRRLYGRG
ncbi:6-N-hydroxylaminopurine resistance protein [Edwardsiella piscicida]|uniref:6-hydroxyaminopurine reductase n=1 Tax=Edwardsiella piscicida TaxID=1263550 RepID=UPI001CED0B8F|nr:6-hydroxyaminopurine reductase [Edwardsiella piscicida]AOP44504.2 6-N-hydroxylaminopurine resistance protein [Edwardsiella piscicida]UCQ57445.1 6-N-hydroxylaminopurine resistance protein [Edwardsiella piscicida]